MLHHHTAQNILGREVLDLTVPQLAHQGRLSGTVGTKDSVATTTNETQLRSVRAKEGHRMRVRKACRIEARLQTRRGSELQHTWPVIDVSK